jgi:hypothetical protein
MLGIVGCAWMLKKEEAEWKLKGEVRFLNASPATAQSHWKRDLLLPPDWSKLSLLMQIRLVMRQVPASVQIPCTSLSTTTCFLFFHILSDHQRHIHLPASITSNTTTPPTSTKTPKSIKMTGGKSGGKASGAKSNAQRYVLTHCAPFTSCLGAFDALFPSKTTRL